MRRRWSMLSFFVITSLAVGCKEDPPTVVVPTEGDEDGGMVCPPPCSLSGEAPAPWNTLTWTFTEFDVDEPDRPAGYQGRMLRADNGTLYYAYLKYAYREATCDIAVFAGGPAPGVNYRLMVATRAAGTEDWDVEQVPLENVGNEYVTSQWGLDATFDNSGNFVIALAGGGSGLASCGSGDLVLATRNGPNNWNIQVAVPGSSACCGTLRDDPTFNNCDPPCLDYPIDPACTSGTDVGAWAAIALADAGYLGVAHSDYHNFWDQDGQHHIGLEFWENGAAATSGIRPWSGEGRYTALRYAGNKPVVAFTGYDGGLGVLHRPTNNGDGNDWVDCDLGGSDYTGWEIGERIRLERAPNDTMGLLFHARKDQEGRAVEDLIYCESDDDGATFNFPCRRIGVGSYDGNNPSLAYDGDSRPYVSYYHCGSNATCPNDTNGLHFAFWDNSAGKWWRFEVHNEARTKSGLHSAIAVDPTTHEPTIIFQHGARGSVIAAQGHFE